MHTSHYRSRSRSTSAESIHKERSRSRSRSPITLKKDLKSTSDLQTKDEHAATTSSTWETSSDASSGDESGSMMKFHPPRIQKRQLPEIAEVFHPQKFVQTPNSHSCTMNGWENVSHQLCKSPLFNEMDGRTSVPIYKLSHITHADKANYIEQENQYVFKPHTKMGKDYDDGTYLCDKNGYVKIQPNETVLPGRFSWWGIDTTWWYNQQEGKNYGKAARRLQSNRVFLAHFLSCPRESPYGDRCFVVDFKDLLECYKMSRTDIADKDDCDVHLQICGTLAYRYEVCYVVIVCTKHDNSLQQYPSLRDSPMFSDKDLVAPDGKIDMKNLCSFEPPNTLHFQPQYVIKCAPTRQYSCYETPAFAFYYPDDGKEYSLKCKKEQVTTMKVEHKKAICKYCHQRD